MNKVKMLFVAAALMLTTVGVFAGKAKFSVSGLYLIDSNGSVVRTITTGTVPFQTSQVGSATIATIQDQSGNTLTFATDVAGTKVAVYTDF